MLVQNHRKNKDRAGARDQKTPRYITDTNLVLGPTNRQKEIHSYTAFCESIDYIQEVKKKNKVYIVKKVWYN